MAKKKSKKTGKKTRRAPAGSRAEPLIPVRDVAFHETARRRYLNYAMSVITSRALPDVRDGLKPVQRRILYTMQHELHVGPTAKPLKCARIVGDVMGKFHPHGDSAIYDTLVRLAQDFSVRYPLIDGQGNFGSLDGDPAAAMRYTEARLTQISTEILSELNRDTVEYRPNYDGKTREPVVLPSRIPNLLVNGATGIAVGLATNIPPHNLAEVCAACEALIENRRLETKELLAHIKGPDFPTGGQILNSKEELRTIYEEGQGPIRVRSEYHIEDKPPESARQAEKEKRIVITSIPYMVQKDVLVKSIGDLVAARKVPQLVDVRDESTKDVRIVLEVKIDADPDVVMAYLFKHTQLASNFNVNLTCLVPADEGGPAGDGSDSSRLAGSGVGAPGNGAGAAGNGAGAPGNGAGAPGSEEGGGAIVGAAVTMPARLDLRSLLLHFIEFRHGVVVRRFQYDLRILRERIHILEGFRKVFDLLDEAIRIIRASEGRADASEKLQRRFELDEIQAGAILDLRLYKLARLEIKAILDELRAKKKEAAGIEAILASEKKLWGIVRAEIQETRETYGDGRRSKIGGRGAQETEYKEEAFIVDEDAFILLSRDGWVKRAGRITDLTKVRLRQGDELLAVAAGNTKEIIVFVTNFGSAYSLRINDVPASRGHGEPIQGILKFKDGERTIAMLSLDPRIVGQGATDEVPEGSVPPVQLLVMGSSGYVARLGLSTFAEPSTRAGRKCARLRDGEELVAAHVVRGGDENVLVATKDGRVTIFAVDDVSFLSGPGRGVIGIKLAESDRVLACGLSRRPSESMVCFTTGNRKVNVSTRAYKVSGRGGRGVEVIKRGGLERVELPPLELPDLPEK